MRPPASLSDRPCCSQVTDDVCSSPSYTLIWWKADTFEKPTGVYMGMYGALAVAQAIFTFLLGSVLALCTFYASVTLHQLAIKSVLKAPQSFFGESRRPAAFPAACQRLTPPLPSAAQTLPRSAAS